MDGETGTLDPDARCVCTHIRKLHRALAGICAALDRVGRSCFCARFRGAPSADLVTEIDMFRALLLDAREHEHELTLEAHDAIADLTATLRLMLGEPDLPSA